MTSLTDPWAESRSTLRAEKPLELTIGAASPLWFLFAGAAATGAAYWWMRQWVKPVNLEAIMSAAEQAVPAALTPPVEARSFEPAPVEEPPEVQALVEPAFSAPALEANAGKASEVAVAAAIAPVEAVAEAVKEVLATPDPDPEPALAAPTPKAKKAKAATPPEA